MIGIGCDVEFKLYPGVGHEPGDINDIFSFFNEHRADDKRSETAMEDRKKEGYF